MQTIRSVQCWFADVNVLGNVGKELCQNSSLAKTSTKEIDIAKIVEEYLKNELTSAIVFRRVRVDGSIFRTDWVCACV